jgi:hypothetical protein
MQRVASLMEGLIVDVRRFCSADIFKAEWLNSCLKYVIPTDALFLNGYMARLHHLNSQIVVSHLVIIFIFLVSAFH